MNPNLRTITEPILNTYPDKNDISLATGNSGRILFLANCYLHTPEEIFHQKAEELMEENFAILHRQITTMSPPFYLHRF